MAGNVPLPAAARQLALGGLHSCAILTDDSVRCWGVNSEGQLGYGDTYTIGDDENGCGSRARRTVLRSMGAQECESEFAPD